MLAAAVAGNLVGVRGRGWNPRSMPVVNHSLGLDQSAYCREEGHWKNECPKMKPITQGGSLQEADLYSCIRNFSFRLKGMRGEH